MDKKHFITDIYDADFDPVVPPPYTRNGRNARLCIWKNVMIVLPWVFVAADVS